MRLRQLSLNNGLWVRDPCSCRILQKEPTVSHKSISVRHCAMQQTQVGFQPSYHHKSTDILARGFDPLLLFRNTLVTGLIKAIVVCDLICWPVMRLLSRVTTVVRQEFITIATNQTNFWRDEDISPMVDQLPLLPPALLSAMVSKWSSGSSHWYLARTCCRHAAHCFSIPNLLLTLRAKRHARERGNPSSRINGPLSSCWVAAQTAICTTAAAPNQESCA